MVDPRRKQQLTTDISDLQATIRADRSRIADLRAMDRADQASTIRNLENNIKHNEQQISKLERELRS